MQADNCLILKPLFKAPYVALSRGRTRCCFGTLPIYWASSWKGNVALRHILVILYGGFCQLCSINGTADLEYGQKHSRPKVAKNT